MISSLNKGVLLGNEGFVLLLKEIFYDQFCTFWLFQKIKLTITLPKAQTFRTVFDFSGQWNFSRPRSNFDFPKTLKLLSAPAHIFNIFAFLLFWPINKKPKSTSHSLTKDQNQDFRRELFSNFRRRLYQKPRPPLQKKNQAHFSINLSKTKINK